MPLLKNNVHFSFTWGLEHMLSWLEVYEYPKMPKLHMYLNIF
jgi:hypothetical protein